MARELGSRKHRRHPVQLRAAVAQLLAQPELQAERRPDALSDEALLRLRDRLEVELDVVCAEIAARQADR
jgi:hypothetical protein